MIWEESLQIIPPPGPLEAELSVMILLLIVGRQRVHTIPPPARDVFPIMLQPVTVGLDRWQWIPPLFNEAELFVMAQLIMLGMDSSQ